MAALMIAVGFLLTFTIDWDGKLTWQNVRPPLLMWTGVVLFKFA